MGTVEKRDRNKKQRHESPEKKFERELKDCMHCKFFWGHNNRCANADNKEKAFTDIHSCGCSVSWVSWLSDKWCVDRRVAQMKVWLAEQGIETESLGKKDVAKLMDEDVRKIDSAWKYTKKFKSDRRNTACSYEYGNSSIFFWHVISYIIFTKCRGNQFYGNAHLYHCHDGIFWTSSCLIQFVK